MKCFAMLIVTCFAALPVFATEQPLTRDFRDWHAGCSSIASACAGWTGSDAGEDSLVVRRARVAQVDWELGFRLPASALAEAQSLVASVGDLHETLQRGRDWYEGEIAGGVVLVDADVDKDDYKGSRLFTAMAGADSLRLDIGTAKGQGRT